MSGENTGRGDYIEACSRFFQRLAGWSYDHRAIVLAACAAVAVASVVLASRTRIDNSFEAYFLREDPAYESYLRFRDDFGSDEIAYILYEAAGHPHGPWNLDVMRKIARLGEALENEVPFVKQATSLANVELLEPVSDGIQVAQLIEDFPSSQNALLEFRHKVLAKPMYVGGLASADGKYGAIVLEMAKSSIDPAEELRVDAEQGNAIDNLYPQASHQRIEEILARPEYDGIVFHHTGDVPLNSVINKITARESTKLGILCFVIVGGLLALFMRQSIGVYGPLAVVALAVVATIGVVGLLGWNLDQMFGMMPALLISVGVADSVHIISEFRVYHARLHDRREAIRRTMYLVGTPCLLTSLTTAAAFGSMAVAPIKAIAHFGVYSAAGVLAAFFLTMTLLVALLAMQRRGSARPTSEYARLRARGGHPFQASLDAIARFDIRHRRSILAFALIVSVASAVGVGWLKVESNVLNEFGSSVPIRQTTMFVDTAMGGTLTFSYLIDTGAPDGIKDPVVLREIERLQAETERHGDIVRKTYSLVDFLKDINQTFHEGDPAYRVVPETRELVAQYLLLYEMAGGEEANDYVSQDYSRTKLELRARMVDSSHVATFMRRMQDYLDERPLSGVSVELTGIGALWFTLMDYITDSQIRGFGLAFVAIGIMMCLLFRSLKLGLLAMLTNLVPVVLTLGGMGWVGVPLDYIRLLVAPIAIGIAVDDTIHHVTRYRHEFLRSRNYAEALRASMVDVGRPLSITSGVLVAGFLVFALSVMDSMAAFGLLLSSTIIMALVADFFLMPALMLTFKPFGPERLVSSACEPEAQDVAA